MSWEVGLGGDTTSTGGSMAPSGSMSFLWESSSWIQTHHVQVNNPDHKSSPSSALTTTTSNLLREPLTHDLISKLLSLDLFTVGVAAGAGHLYPMAFQYGSLWAKETESVLTMITMTVQKFICSNQTAKANIKGPKKKSKWLMLPQNNII